MPNLLGTFSKSENLSEHQRGTVELAHEVPEGEELKLGSGIWLYYSSLFPVELRFLSNIAPKNPQNAVY